MLVDNPNMANSERPQDVFADPEHPFKNPQNPRLETTQTGGNAANITETEMETKQDEQTYHVFSKSQKWLVVVMIGAAGLFSGLSSNIYFPSLDKIATVSNHCRRSLSVILHSLCHASAKQSTGLECFASNGLPDHHILPHRPGNSAGYMGLIF